MCHSFATQQPKPRNKNHLYLWKARQGLRVVHECFPLFVENKTSPTRHKPNSGKLRAAWDLQREKLLTEAMREVLFCLVLYFAKDASAQEVVAVVLTRLYFKAALLLVTGCTYWRSVTPPHSAPSDNNAKVYLDGIFGRFVRSLGVLSKVSHCVVHSLLSFT